MRKILLVIFALFFMPIFASAIEELPEIELDVPEEKLNIDDTANSGNLQGGIAQHKIYLDDEDKLKLHLDGHFINELKIGAVYNGGFTQNFQNDPSNYSTKYDIFFLDTWIEGKFKNEKTSFKINVNPVRYVPNRKYIATLWQDIWVKHDINDNQSIMAGYYRTPNGEEGSISAYVQDFAYRSQIARTFANARATGVKNSGRYKYFDYDIGLFDSARYFDSCLKGVELVAKGTIKPLEFAPDGKYGHLKIMGSVNTGKHYDSYTVLNAYVGYNYKKLTLSGEYAHANGYNGPSKHSSARAQGFYTSIKYELTPKLHLLARYDVFDPNRKKSGNNVDEYSIGINYYPIKRVKIMLDYVIRHDRAASTSNQIVLVTQFQI